MTISGSGARWGSRLVAVAALSVTAACGSQVPDAVAPTDELPTATSQTTSVTASDEPTSETTTSETSTSETSSAPTSETTTSEATSETTSETTTEEPTSETTTDDPTSETTTEGPTTEEPTDGGTGGGSRDDPLALGESFELGDYTVRVIGVDTDAEDAAMAENEFNDPAAEGEQFVMIGVEATYNGEETGLPWIDLAFSVVGSGGNTFNDDCGVIPDDLMMIDELYSGASATGNACVRVDADQVEGATIAVEDFMSFDGEPVFVAIE